MTFTLSNRITLFVVKSVAGMATDLTINYADFDRADTMSIQYRKITVHILVNGCLIIMLLVSTSARFIMETSLFC